MYVKCLFFLKNISCFNRNEIVEISFIERLLSNICVNSTTKLTFINTYPNKKQKFNNIYYK